MLGRGAVVFQRGVEQVDVHHPALGAGFLGGVQYLDVVTNLERPHGEDQQRTKQVGQHAPRREEGDGPHRGKAGESGAVLFGLPGNPISTVIGLRFFLMPLLRQILGMSEETPEWAQLAAPYDKTGDLRLFLKSHVTTDPTGRSVIDLLQGQESFKISPFLNTNAWAILDETPRSYNKGQAVMYYPNDLLR